MSATMNAPSTALQTIPAPVVQDYLPAVDPKAVEQALLIGDISQMSDEVRIAYYVATCRSLGLNPLTKPFQALKTDDGKVTLYPDKGCAEQLRKLHRVSVRVLERRILDDLYIVTVRATTPDGREEESQGIVPIAKAKGTWEDYEFRGEKKRRFKAAIDQDGHEVMIPLSAAERANAMMRGETKAKRRVTLAICGLGLPDTDIEGSGHPMALDLRTGSMEHETQNLLLPSLTDTTGQEQAAQATDALFGDGAGDVFRSPANPAAIADAALKAIDSAHMDHGHDAAWLARYWTKMCKRFQVETKENLSLDIQQSLLEEVRTFYAKQEGANLPHEGTKEAQPPSGSTLSTPESIVEHPGGFQPLLHPSAWRDTLEAHKDTTGLPKELKTKVKLALHPGSETTDAKGLELAGAVLDWLTTIESGEVVSSDTP